MKHIAVLSGFLVSLGASVAGLKDGWHEAITPAFVGGFLGQVGTILMAVYMDAPKSKDPMGVIDQKILADINKQDNNQKPMGV